MKNGMRPIILNSGEGKPISVGNSKLFLKLASEAALNKLSITENHLSPNFPGPPLLKHKLFEHAWYVLEGGLTVELNDETSALTKGSFIFILKNTIHAFANKSDSLTRVLVIDIPGGFEHYIMNSGLRFAMVKP